MNRADNFMDYVANLEKALQLYMERHPRLYIYGAGKNGLLMKRFLERRNWNIEGFVVTDIKKEKSAVLESLPVIGIDSLEAKGKTGILVAVSPKFRDEVVGCLQSKGYQDVYIPSVSMASHIAEDIYTLQEEDVKKFLRKHPIKKIPRGNIHEWNKILLISTNNIGDVIMQIPFLRELRANCPEGTKITMVCQGIVAPFLERSGYVNRVIVCDGKINWGNCLEDLEEGAQSFVRDYLGNAPYDAVISLGWYRTMPHQFFLAICSNAPVKISFSEHLFPERELYNRYYDDFFSLVVSSSEVMHEVAANLYMLENLGGIIDSNELEFWTTEEEEQYAEKVFGKYQDQPEKCFVAVVPHANALDRMWDMENYLELMRSMIQKYPEIVFVVLGGKQAVEIVQPIMKFLPCAQAIDLTGTTSMGEAAAVLKRCNLYIGCNTGLMHIAAAWKVPTVEIVPHPQDGNPAEYPSPERYHAWGNRSYVVRPRTALPGCGGSCYKMEAHCINQIRVEEAMNVVDEAIRELDKSLEERLE